MKKLFNKQNPMIVTPARRPVLDLIKCADALPFDKLCNVLYTVVADRSDIDPQVLEQTADKLRRVAWQKERER